MSIKILILFLLSFLGASSQAVSTPIAHEFVGSPSESIEVYWAKPKGTGPFPLLMLLHPEQESPKLGGKVFVESGQVEYWTGKGYIVVAPSQPGYGESLGAPDFCGEKTQNAVRRALEYFKSKPEVNARQLFLYGGSRGAVVASMIATKNIPLAGIILKSGVYDFIEWSKRISWYNGIKLTMLWEVGWLSEEKLKSRSAIYLADRIKAPLLVVHGSQDDRAPIKGALKFAKSVNDAGGKARVVAIESQHIIPMPQISGAMEEFMKSIRK